MGLFKRNPWTYIIRKKKIPDTAGCSFSQSIVDLTEMEIDGSRFPTDHNVLFVSNHQTYFADVVSMFHVLSHLYLVREDSIKNVDIWKLN
jgi:hypothetical protein